MTRVVWKFAIQPVDRQTIPLPVGAKPLCVQMQNNLPHMWAECDPDEARIERRYFSTFGTGHPGIPEDANYIGTFQMENGALVFHFYEVK
jgi:hypothetical protein